MAQLTKEQWLERLPKSDREDLETCVSGVLDFAHHHPLGTFLNTSGLYAVGSTVRETQDFNDIDLALVGLDFRALFSYDPVFLGDPQALLAEGVLARGSCDNDYGDNVLCAGEEYHYVPREDVRYITLSLFTMSRLTPSPFTVDLHSFLEARLNVSPRAHPSLNPLEPYACSSTEFCVIRFPLRRIDLSIHAENLFVPHWKTMQEELGLPYVPLHEFEHADTTNILGRGIFTWLPYPEFIDYRGKARSERTTGMA